MKTGDRVKRPKLIMGYLFDEGAAITQSATEKHKEPQSITSLCGNSVSSLCNFVKQFHTN